MPSFSSPNYIHLRMPTNESSMQLISMEGDTTPSGSPCFNAPPPDAAPRITYKSGSKPLGAAALMWRSRTCLERFLLLAVISLILLVGVLLAVVLKLDKSQAPTHITIGSGDSFVPGPGDLLPEYIPTEPPAPPTTSTWTTRTTTVPKKEEPEICTTPGCVRAANNLLNAMNQSASPCDNFFEFACGAWNRDHPIPDDMFAYGTFAYVREQVRQQLRVLLETNTVSSSKSINMARTAYKICMNTTQLDSLNTTLLLSALEDLGHWPMLRPQKWVRDNFDLTKLLAESRREYGTDVFYQIYVYADSKNTTKNTLFIDQGSLTLGRGARDYYLNETMFATQMAAYKKYIREVLTILHQDANVSSTKEEMNTNIDELLKFETQLARLIVPEDDRRNNTRMYNKMKIADLYQLMPQIEWIDFFSLIAPGSIGNYFSNETEIIVCEIEYLRKVAELLNSTDKKILTDYVLWRVVQSTIKFLDDRFENIKQDLMRVMTGQQTKSPRWKECAQVPSTFLPLAAGAIYIREHFNAQDKTQALEMIGNLRQSFTELVKENDWMDEKTKEVAIGKAANIINHIGYPDISNDDQKLDKKYEKLEITQSDTYFGMMRKAVVWMQEKEFLKLQKPFDKFEFDVSPAVVNAFYSPEKNAITFPAGILQPPFFSGTFPKAVNYGAIGAVIGHEITHGFDDQGSQYDKHGNLQNWWNSDSLAGFEKRKQCIVEQYGNYTVPDTSFKVNGKLTQGENIADNGGVKEAYKAYRKYISQLGKEEPRLPGLGDYSNDQIFFLSYAHFWCGHKKEAAAVQQVLTDEHSPELFRVIGVLSNLEEFSKAYNCPVGSPLNPVKKCRVW